MAAVDTRAIPSGAMLDHPWWMLLLGAGMAVHTIVVLRGLRRHGIDKDDRLGDVSGFASTLDD